MSNIIASRVQGFRQKLRDNLNDFREMSKRDKMRTISDLFFNNAMIIIILLAVIIIAILQPAFLSLSSIINIISLTAG